MCGVVLQVLFLGPLMQLAMDCPWSFMDGVQVAFGETANMLFFLLLLLLFSCRAFYQALFLYIIYIFAKHFLENREILEKEIICEGGDKVVVSKRVSLRSI